MFGGYPSAGWAGVRFVCAVGDDADDIAESSERGSYVLEVVVGEYCLV